jgi:hypothetical protein
MFLSQLTFEPVVPVYGDAHTADRFPRPHHDQHPLPEPCLGRVCPPSRGSGVIPVVRE